MMSVTILHRGGVCSKIWKIFFSSIFVFKAAYYMDVHQSFLLPLGKRINKIQALCSRVQCKQAKKMVSSPLSMCCASSACGFLWLVGWPVETTAQVCASVCAKLVCFSSSLFSCSPAKTCCCRWTHKRAQQRESQHRGAAFSLLPALAVGNEAQGELPPPLLIWQGCVLPGSLSLHWSKVFSFGCSCFSPQGSRAPRACRDAAIIMYLQKVCSPAYLTVRGRENGNTSCRSKKESPAF